MHAAAVRSSRALHSGSGAVAWTEAQVDIGARFRVREELGRSDARRGDNTKDEGSSVPLRGRRSSPTTSDSIGTNAGRAGDQDVAPVNRPVDKRIGG